MDLILQILPEAVYVEERIYPMCKKYRYKHWLICPDCRYIINEQDHSTIQLKGTFKEKQEILKSLTWI